MSTNHYGLVGDQNQAETLANKQEILKKLQLAQKQQYDRKKATMLGVGQIKLSSALQKNGQLTLDQMALDRRDEFEGDAYDPFNYQQRQLKGDSMQLTQAANYMNVQSTVGQQIWTPDQQKDH